MANELTEEQISVFTEAFKMFDRDSSKKTDANELSIDTEELDLVMTSLGQNHTESELKEILNEVDVDNSGSIELKEFLDLMGRKMKENSSDKEIHDTFREFDKHDTGYISAEELKHVMNNLGLKLTNVEINEMMKEASQGNDENPTQISYEEFAMMMPKDFGNFKHCSELQTNRRFRKISKK